MLHTVQNLCKCWEQYEICVCVNACKVQSVCVNELAVARHKLQSEMDSRCSRLLKIGATMCILVLYLCTHTQGCSRVCILCELTSFNYDNWRPRWLEESCRLQTGEMSCMETSTWESPISG